MALPLRTRWLSPLSLFVRRRRHPVPRAHRLRYRPRLDLLEPRLAPATFTVNDPGTDDLANPQDHTAQTRNQTITLISALEQNEYDGGGDVIQFIGPMTISVTDFTGLGDPEVPITIVGLKQGNGPGVTIDHASGGDQELIIGGGSSVSDLNLMNMGLWAYGDGCTIEDVYSIGGREGFSFESNTTLDHCVVSGKTFGVINPHERDPAVRIGSGCTVQNCFIGTTPDGTGLLGNANADGLEVWGSNNTITHNVIAGSQFDGLDLYGDNNQVQGNRIGTDITGTVALGNGWAGISVGGSHNLIGGSGGKGNIISGNTFPVRAISWGDGVDINRGVGNIIQGNYIGTDASGTQPLGNSDDGIVDYGSGTIIGGLGAGNVISGNGGNGIALIDATGTIIQGNYIGTDINGTNPLGNGGVGVNISASPNNVIGAPIAGAGNLIDCNGRVGIFLGSGSNGVIVQGNYIGTNPAGADLANQGSGITINGSSNNRIGGINDGEANVIAYDGQASLSGPACNGVTIIESTIDPPAVGNTIRGNSIYRIRHDVTGLPHGLGIALGLGTPFRLLDPNAGTDNYAFRLNDLEHADAATGLVTADNQEGDDSRPNHLQHYPVYLGTDAQGIGHWQLNSTPNRPFEIDFYSNSSPNPSGYGDGQTLLTSLEVATDANGHVVFATPAAVVGQPYVSATATDAVNGDTSQFSMVNTSGDGLADAWKLWGIDVNGDGTPDLMLPGADVHQRDLYVEIDAMAGRAPSANALNMVTQVFANHGIDLHLILGDTAAPLTSPWLDDAGTDFPEAAFDAFKVAHFGIPAAQGNPLALAAERLAFRYCVFADTYQVGTDPVGRAQHASGAGKGNIASDFFIALGPDGGGDDFEQAGTFMHELGHSLGLRHGGGGTAPDASGDDINNKPNYFSVMNYLWQAPFTDYADPNHPTALELAYHNSWELDYSEQALPTLDEGALDEAAGIGGDPTKMLRLADGSGQFVPMGGPVDWNQDGIAGDAPLVQRRLNGDPRIETLVGHEDWSHLSFYFLESPYLISRTHSDPPPPPVAPSEGTPVWIGDNLAANGTQDATWSRSSTTGTELANSLAKYSPTVPNCQPLPAVSGSPVVVHSQGARVGAEHAPERHASEAWIAEAESVQHRDALFATVWSETC